MKELIYLFMENTCKCQATSVAHHIKIEIQIRLYDNKCRD